MTKYWQVTTKFYDSGKVISNITATVVKDKKPADTSNELANCDAYQDYFASEAEANEWVKEAYNA